CALCIAVSAPTDTYTLSYTTLFRSRICRTRYAHRLKNVSTPRQRIANCTTDTSGSAAKRLDFGWVVVGFIFELQQPFFFHAVHRSEEHTSELQSRENLVCRLLLEKK